ncbi:hypothetical protein RB196_26490 [Streptomyces sp. PmtA]|uniref:hypothetical protein n=1 Tax=Streptomyces sp. PmtA TaxID=3074275 RepID=UPI003014AC3D
MKAEGTDDFDADNDTANTLVGIRRRAEHHIRSNSTVMAALDDINSGYLERFSIGSDTLEIEEWRKDEISVDEAAMRIYRPPPPSRAVYQPGRRLVSSRTPVRQARSAKGRHSRYRPPSDDLLVSVLNAR